MPEARWPCLRPGPTGGSSVLLDVAVVPGARRTGADGLHDGALRVRLVARPVEGQANAALLAWLADELRCAKRELRLITGETSRRKRVAIDASPERVAAWLDRVLAEGSNG